MASKVKSVYVCSECGFESAKWYGKCPGCGEWNTLNEELKETSKSTKAGKISVGPRVRPQKLYEISEQDEPRYCTGISELDRVLGGGIVKGSLVLIGGDPGIGKSTILLQICNHLGESLEVLYVSGEESIRQLKLRASRLGVDSKNLSLLAQTDIESIEQEIMSMKPDIVMIDSIQTMNHAELNSTTGSVTQVKECTNVLMRVAKSLDIPVIIVGHVNKDGNNSRIALIDYVAEKYDSIIAHYYHMNDKLMELKIYTAKKSPLFKLIYQ